MWWVKPGAKCVCIDDVSTNPNWGGTHRVVKGQTYTVRDSWTTPKGSVLVVFEEIVNRKVLVLESMRLREWAFLARRFRPIVPMADDLALFTHHLIETKAKELV